MLGRSAGDKPRQQEPGERRTTIHPAVPNADSRELGDRSGGIPDVPIDLVPIWSAARPPAAEP
jgi:hypothetical protein